jgi:hypothetical protein
MTHSLVLPVFLPTPVQTEQAWTQGACLAAASCFTNLRSLTINTCFIPWTSVQPMLQQLPTVRAVTYTCSAQHPPEGYSHASWLAALLSCHGLEQLTFTGQNDPVPFRPHAPHMEVQVSDTLTEL